MAPPPQRRRRGFTVIPIAGLPASGPHPVCSLLIPYLGAVPSRAAPTSKRGDETRWRTAPRLSSRRGRLMTKTRMGRVCAGLAVAGAAVAGCSSSGSAATGNSPAVPPPHLTDPHHGRIRPGRRPCFAGVRLNLAIVELASIGHRNHQPGSCSSRNLTCVEFATHDA